MTTRGGFVPVGAYLCVRPQTKGGHTGPPLQINCLFERNSVSQGFACFGNEFNLPQKGLI